MWHSDMHFGWMMLSWIGIVVTCAIGLRYALGGFRGTSDGGDSPEEILKRRFAKGEIDREEYETRLEVLRK
jgi:putative membrane protein